MKISLKGFWVLLLILGGLQTAARAGQQVYLSESPNGKYRILVEQVLDRRVGDRFFFRYPLILENTKDSRRHFQIVDAGSPLIYETDKGTFKLTWDKTHSTSWDDVHQGNWDVIHFDWAPDNLKVFIRLEIMEGSWKTYFVDVNSGKTKDITPELEEKMVSRVEFHDWDCQQPVIELVQWTKPYLAFFKLTGIYGADKDKENNRLHYLRDSVLYDTVLEKVVSNCDDCKDDKSLNVFDKYYLKSLPTPTPIPEETPTGQ